MKRDITTIVIGLLFLLTGIAIGGSMLGFFDFTINFAGWWTLFLILPALFAILQGGFNTGNLILLSIGVVLLLDAQQLLPRNFSWRLVLPLVLLVVGFQLLFGTKGNNKPNEKNSGSSKKEYASYSEKNNNTNSTHNSASYKTASTIFSGQDIKYGKEEFTGASYTAIFGGCKVDLRNVTIVGDVVITVTALFGGFDLILPDNVQVISNITPVLGGSDCKYESSRDPLAPKVIINGTVAFGGIEIK